MEDGCEEDLMDRASIMSKDSDGEGAGQGWQAPKSKKTRKTRKVVVATRTSTRVPIAEKAAQRAMERNNVSGTTKNAFAILNSVPNSQLQDVVRDLDLEMGNVDEYLDAFKAEEVARARIAEANYNAFLERQKMKNAPQSEEDEQEFAMMVISNQHRDINLDHPNGDAPILMMILTWGRGENFVSIMKIIFWNVRGLGKSYRRSLVRKHILFDNLEIVALQETIKQDFDDGELKELAGSQNFSWYWSPSGGLILGVNNDNLEVEDTIFQNFFLGVLVRNKIFNHRFWILNVYGPAQHQLSGDFIQELSSFCCELVLLVLMGGDFNLIRNNNERNQGVGDPHLMKLFNDFIGNFQLREIFCSGNRFT